jgi:hypothetical protein
MMQLELPMLTLYKGPSFLSQTVVESIQSYREAVHTCWLQRTRPRLTQAQLAEETGLYAAHITDYVSAKPGKRNLPAEHIQVFQHACGNRVISQWLMYREGLSIMEQVIEERRRA